jgi:hypothetical protein
MLFDNIKLLNMLLQDLYRVAACLINWRNHCEICYCEENIIS